ncbi:MAG: biopolymer transporter ExbD [Spirochaetaceae bacterium]|jgi:biopolymer transport protein ExbD|nr:biopolymer transporter ExbD [Spirochaetaceae bacterium]
MAFKLGRKRKRSRFEDAGASSDIAFLLIIYFIVIAGFNVNKGFLLRLPAKDSSRMILKEDLLRFELDSRGALRYQGRVIDLGTAEKEINSAVQGNANLAVVLSIAPETSWQQVVAFVELAQTLEVQAFSFSMKEQPSAGGPS